MLIKNWSKFLHLSTLKISSIKHHETNMSILPFVLNLSPDKNKLQQLIKSQLDQICPNQNKAKEAFIKLQVQIQDLYQVIKNEILYENDSELDNIFFQRAHYYFQKQGKKIRPLMIKMLSDNFKSLLQKSSKNKIDFTLLDRDIEKWCALMEIMHIASLAHDDIVDDSPSRRGQQSQHLKFGSKIAVFSGDYIISKASKTVAEFDQPRLYEIYAYTMSSLADGEIKQLIAKRQNKFTNQIDSKDEEFNKMMNRYMEKTFFKSAALMCGSLLGVPSIFQKHLGNNLPITLNNSFQQIQERCFRIGQHYGLALQLIDDNLDYISTASEMGKQQMSDLVQGNVTAPVYLTYKHKQQIALQLLNKNKKTKQDALVVKKWVQSGVGIELTYVLGCLHCKQGIKKLQQFGINEEDILAWRYLGYKLITRKK